MVLSSVDGLGNIHVLHQAGPQQFSHNSFTPYGYPVEQEQYAGGGTRMQFYRSTDGSVAVEGGSLHAADGDIDAVDGEVVEFEDLLR